MNQEFQPRLAVQTVVGSTEEELLLRSCVTDVLGFDSQGERWRVERLFPDSVDCVELARHFSIRGFLDLPQEVEGRLLEELADRLAKETGFQVQPEYPAGEWNITERVRFHRYLRSDEFWSDFDSFEDSAPFPESAPKDWPLKAMRLLEAWSLEPPNGGKRFGEGVRVAVPDTGYSNHFEGGLHHFDLLRDRDILGRDDDALDPFIRGPFTSPGHGTTVAACIGARKVAELQGAAPGAMVIPIRCVKHVVRFWASDVSRAVDHARRNGAHVISLSLGSPALPGLQSVIDAALADGIIVIAAGGQIFKVPPAPAVYPGVIGVGASNVRNQPWSQTTPGSHIAWCAPGKDVWVPAYDFDQNPPQAVVPRQGEGSSYSVAFTAGVAALWLAYHNPQKLRDLYGSRLAKAFRKVAADSCLVPSGWDTARYGSGILQADRVLSATLPNLSEL